MSKAVEVNELERYNKRLCEFCDFNIARFEMHIIKNEESIVSTIFCEDCFDEFTDMCYILLNEGEGIDEKDNL